MTDTEEILRATRGYFEAFVNVSPELVRSHFLPTASKVGFMYDYASEQFMPLAIHDFEQIVEWASRYNASGVMPASAPHITVLDARAKTAVVKLTADWAPDRPGVDYVLLVKPANKWLISSILWQSDV
jgi:hypothetical protein